MSDYESLSSLLSEIEKVKEKVDTADVYNLSEIFGAAGTLRPIIDSLKRLHDQRAVEPLIGLFKAITSRNLTVINEDNNNLLWLEDEVWCSLMDLAFAFQRLKDPRAIDVLLKGLGYERTGHGRAGEYQGVALAALEALGYFKDPNASEVLTRLLNESKSPGYQRIYLSYLEKIGDKEAVQGLAYALEHFKEIRADAGAALDRLKYERGLLICDRCNHLRTELRRIDEITPRYFEICKPCWDDLEPLQDNPDTRTVISCGWEDKTRTLDRSEEQAS